MRHVSRGLRLAKISITNPLTPNQITDFASLGRFARKYYCCLQGRKSLLKPQGSHQIWSCCCRCFYCISISKGHSIGDLHTQHNLGEHARNFYGKNLLISIFMISWPLFDFRRFFYSSTMSSRHLTSILRITFTSEELINCSILVFMRVICLHVVSNVV